MVTRAWHVVRHERIGLALKAALSLVAFVAAFPGYWLVRVSTQGLTDAAAAAGDEATFGLTLALQGLGGAVCLTAVTWLLTRWSDLTRPTPDPGFWRGLLRAAGAGALLGFVGFALLWWFKAVPAALVYRGFLGSPSVWVPVWIMCAGAIGGAAEEYYFRGLLLRQFNALLPCLLARWGSVCVFTAWHLYENRSLSHLAFIAVLGYACTRRAEEDGYWVRAAVFHALLNSSFNLLANFQVLFLGRGA